MEASIVSHLLYVSPFYFGFFPCLQGPTMFRISHNLRPGLHASSGGRTTALCGHQVPHSRRGLMSCKTSWDRSQKDDLGDILYISPPRKDQNQHPTSRIVLSVSPNPDVSYFYATGLHCWQRPIKNIQALFTFPMEPTSQENIHWLLAKIQRFIFYFCIFLTSGLSQTTSVSCLAMLR